MGANPTSRPSLTTPQSLPEALYHVSGGGDAHLQPQGRVAELQEGVTPDKERPWRQ